MSLKDKLAAAMNRANQSPMDDGDKKKKSSKNKKPNGTYIVSSNGRVGRTTPSGVPGRATYESMDTTGYSKGKKNFVVKESPISTSGTKIINADSYKTIDRKEVPNKIKEFKKGATRTVVYKKAKG